MRTQFICTLTWKTERSSHPSALLGTNAHLHQPHRSRRYGSRGKNFTLFWIITNFDKTGELYGISKTKYKSRNKSLGCLDNGFGLYLDHVQIRGTALSEMDVTGSGPRRGEASISKCASLIVPYSVFL